MGLFGSPSASSPQDRVDIDHLTERVAALEAAVQHLQGQLASTTAPAGDRAVAPPDGGARSAVAEPSFMVEVRGLLARGKKIQAIKVYREQTGVDLLTAKNAVERLS